MLKSVEFKNFKALRDATLPLAPFTMILGPNGSGKSTVLQALHAAASSINIPYQGTLSVGAVPRQGEDVPSIRVALEWDESEAAPLTEAVWNIGGQLLRRHLGRDGVVLGPPRTAPLDARLGRFRFYALDADKIARPVGIQPSIELAPDGSNFAGVLDRLRDEEPDRFEALNKELARWLPEYDRVVLNTQAAGQKGFALRTRKGRYSIPASQLSQGSLLALALLTLAYLPDPPTFVGLEEPDRGLHPRLLRDLRDALYRLSYPESCGETRPPVQVLVTTHSPYFLDLYRDHPEEIVLAQKEDLDVRFERLSDKPDFEEILGDAPLSEVWYSGILGGVPQPS